MQKDEEININSRKSYQEEMKDQMVKNNEAMEQLKDLHSKEINAISQSYLAKISILKEKEENGLLQIETLKNELMLYKEDIDNLRKILEKDKGIKKIAIKSEDEHPISTPEPLQPDASKQSLTKKPQLSGRSKKDDSNSSGSSSKQKKSKK